MDTFSDYFPYRSLEKYRGLLGKIPMDNPEMYVGVELEIENVVGTYALQGLPHVWKVTRDGSLKNNGLEFVTIPIRCKYLEQELQRLFSFLNKDIQYSSRCSVHVHLNVRDLTVEELKTFLLVYMCFEKALYRFSGNRWKNIFCVPLYEYNDQVKAVIKLNEIKSLVGYGWFKYSGLNLSPIWGSSSAHSTKDRIGTAEFRQMEGTNDINRILSWINIITNIKAYCKAVPFSHFIETLKRLNTTSSYYELANVVFKANAVDLFLTKETLEDCITRAKTCLPREGKYLKEI